VPKPVCCAMPTQAVSDLASVRVAQQALARRGVPLLGVLYQRGHQGRGDRLPAECLAFLPEHDQALLAVQVPVAQRERAPASAGGLGAEPQDERV
jgi:hypothetical protein